MGEKASFSILIKTRQKLQSLKNQLPDPTSHVTPRRPIRVEDFFSEGNNLIEVFRVRNAERDFLWCSQPRKVEGWRWNQGSQIPHFYFFKNGKLFSNRIRSKNYVIFFPNFGPPEDIEDWLKSKWRDITDCKLQISCSWSVERGIFILKGGTINQRRVQEMSLADAEAAWDKNLYKFGDGVKSATASKSRSWHPKMDSYCLFDAQKCRQIEPSFQAQGAP